MAGAGQSWLRVNAWRSTYLQPNSLCAQVQNSVQAVLCRYAGHCPGSPAFAILFFHATCDIFPKQLSWFETACCFQMSVPFILSTASKFPVKSCKMTLSHIAVQITVMQARWRRDQRPRLLGIPTEQGSGYAQSVPMKESN